MNKDTSKPSDPKQGIGDADHKDIDATYNRSPAHNSPGSGSGAGGKRKDDEATAGTGNASSGTR